MFTAELNNPTILKTSFDAISSIIDEVSIQTDNTGLRLKAIDRSHITYVELELKTGLFSKYKCSEPEKINIDTNELMKILKRAKNDDRVQISLNDGNFIITFIGEATRTFKIRLIDMEYENPEPPQIPYETVLEIPFHILKNGINDTGLFSDKVLLKTTPNEFIISTESNFGDANITYPHGENVEETVESLFSTEKLMDMLRADKFTDTVQISMGDDLPLCLKLETIMEDACISFLLAPRLDSEEEEV